jgi:N-acetylglucosaminyldiphosphoundecaprenol N-acetyl-beta-D-mannosaminyltransferase
MDRDRLLALISKAARDKFRLIVCSANLHGLYCFERNTEYRELLGRQQSIVIIDGMPVLHALRFLGFKLSSSVRTTWIDWFEILLRRSEQECRSVYILGHSQALLTAGLTRARTQFPSLRIAGRSGYFDITSGSTEAQEVVAEINNFDPDILIVGMGMPRQEEFVGRNAENLNAAVIGLGGAAFAYYAGFERSPPRWMGRVGLEWLHRLATNPSRLAFRYLFEPILLTFQLFHRLIVSPKNGRRRRQDSCGRGAISSDEE